MPVGADALIGHIGSRDLRADEGIVPYQNESRHVYSRIFKVSLSLPQSVLTKEQFFAPGLECAAATPDCPSFDRPVLSHAAAFIRATGDSQATGPASPLAPVETLA